MLIHCFPFFTSIFQQNNEAITGYDHPLPSPTQSLISRGFNNTLLVKHGRFRAIVKVTESYLYWHRWFFNCTSVPHQKPAILMNYFWPVCSWDSSGFQLWLHIGISWGALKSYQYSDFITVLLMQSCCGVWTTSCGVTLRCSRAEERPGTSCTF